MKVKKRIPFFNWRFITLLELTSIIIYIDLGYIKDGSLSLIAIWCIVFGTIINSDRNRNLPDLNNTGTPSVPRVLVPPPPPPHPTKPQQP